MGTNSMWGQPPRLSTDASGNVTGLVDPTGGNPYGFAVLPKDVNGNAIANVNHRTGTLASLLALNGGNGEISVATDAKALVRHNGVVGGAVPFYLSGVYAAVVIDTAAAGLTPTGAAGAPLGLLNPVMDEAGLFSPTAINIPDELKGTDPNFGPAIAVNAHFVFGASAVGTVRRIALEYMDSATPWTEVVTKSTPVVANAELQWQFSGFGGVLGSTGRKFRFVAYQDSGADMSVGMPAYSYLHFTVLGR